GEGVLFDDTWSHEIKNECSETRVVLIVDILRPMRGMAGLVNWAMFLVGRYFYALIVSRKAHSFSLMIRAPRRDRCQYRLRMPRMNKSDRPRLACESRTPSSVGLLWGMERTRYRGRRRPG